MRGKGSFTSKSFGVSADVELAVAEGHRARLEFPGPFGIRLAMLLINDEWVQLYVPRENTVSRFPKSELYKDTERRERFLKMIPMPVVPEAFFQGLLTQVGGLKINETKVPAGVSCEVDTELRAYRIRLPGNSVSELGGRYVWVEGETFYPVQVQYFERFLPPKYEAANMRPSFEIRFSKFSGRGVATLPRKMELQILSKTEMSFEWANAEKWDAPNGQVFEWRPAASMTVKDY